MNRPLTETLIALAAILGLSMVLALILIPVPQDGPLTESSDCIFARHMQSHQEGAMLQCALTPQCLITADDYSKRDYYEEDVARLCPAPKVEPEPQIQFSPEPAQPEPSHKPQEGSIKRDGFTAWLEPYDAGAPTITRYPNGLVEVRDRDGRVTSSWTESAEPRP